MNLRENTWRRLDVRNGHAGWLHSLIVVLIILNVLAVIVGSMHAVFIRWRLAFRTFEGVSVAIFTVEYLARVWSCTADSRYQHPVWGRIRFMLSPLALIDLIAILPSYLLVLRVDLRFIRILRIATLARVGKLGRYSEASSLLLKVIRSRRDEMCMTFSLLTLLAVVAAAFMYFAENSAQPDKFPHIPAALWWAFITITTVGYGDVFPVTMIGKVIAIFTALIGILMIALPTGVFGAAFLDEINRTRRATASPRQCPHCGKPIDSP